MRKVYTIILAVTLVMLLAGCSGEKTDATTEVASTKATATNASNTEATVTDATKTDATSEATVTDATNTDATKEASETDASSTETTEATATKSDAIKLTETQVLTENIDGEDFILNKYSKGTDERIIFGFDAHNEDFDPLFEIVVGDEGSDDVEITVQRTLYERDDDFMVYLTGDVTDIDGIYHPDMTGGYVEPIDGRVEFTITYSDGKAMHVVVNCEK